MISPPAAAWRQSARLLASSPARLYQQRASSIGISGRTVNGQSWDGRRTVSTSSTRSDPASVSAPPSATDDRPAEPVSRSPAAASSAPFYNPPGSHRVNPSSRPDEPNTHFGFRTIAQSAKEGLVGSVFSSVAPSYDIMNDLMSFGIHRLWKDHFVRSLNPGTPAAGPGQGWHILDVAGGTGDIAFRMLDHASTINQDQHTRVTVSDINGSMLAEGRKRAATHNGDGAYLRAGRVSFLQANAEDLTAEVPDGSVDLYTVAFGIRNFTNKDVALREAFRVLKPGGVFACLEFAPRLQNPALNAIYKQWSFQAIPQIGQLVANDRDSYQYLVESIERFPSQPEWRQMIADAGFAVPPVEAGWEDLTFGIASIHKGVKPV